MRYIFSCGGTAGHINPAIAIADKLRQIDKDSEIFFVGSAGGMEQGLVERAGYPIWSLDVCGIKRRISISNLKAVVKAIKATHKAEAMIRELRPDAVIGTGGYVCYPMVRAASKLGIYTAIHESNAVPGLAVKMLKNKVDKIFVSFDACKSRLGVPEKCKVSGNPISGGFEALTREQAREKLGMAGKYRYLIVSFGGSLGAKTVNKCALEVMEQLSAQRADILHVHSYGRIAKEEFCKEFRMLGFDRCKNIIASEYIYDMPTYLKAADIVICRSGAMTLAEIATAGVASVLIPSPNVTANHQYENAMALAAKNAAFVVNEKDENDLRQATRYVRDLICHRELRDEMARNARLFSHTDASDTIARDIMNECSIKKG